MQEPLWLEVHLDGSPSFDIPQEWHRPGNPTGRGLTVALLYRGDGRAVHPLRSDQSREIVHSVACKDVPVKIHEQDVRQVPEGEEIDRLRECRPLVVPDYTDSLPQLRQLGARDIDVEPPGQPCVSGGSRTREALGLRVVQGQLVCPFGERLLTLGELELPRDGRQRFVDDRLNQGLGGPFSKVVRLNDGLTVRANLGVHVDRAFGCTILLIEDVRWLPLPGGLCRFFSVAQCSSGIRFPVLPVQVCFPLPEPLLQRQHLHLFLEHIALELIRRSGALLSPEKGSTVLDHV
mmetsp:Transcript_78832/g.139319  ORF Transcript_78832/g.139319 Transcript_78832/m.139319 type:complete len:291 (+) Transcript_78832:343-1215(+)